MASSSQPAFIFHREDWRLHDLHLLGALPTASMTAMFAVQYNVYKEESDATILFSTVLSIATLGIVIALTSSMAH